MANETVSSPCLLCGSFHHITLGLYFGGLLISGLVIIFYGYDLWACSLGRFGVKHTSEVGNHHSPVSTPDKASRVDAQSDVVKHLAEPEVFQKVAVVKSTGRPTRKETIKALEPTPSSVNGIPIDDFEQFMKTQQALQGKQVQAKQLQSSAKKAKQTVHSQRGANDLATKFRLPKSPRDLALMTKNGQIESAILGDGHESTGTTYYKQMLRGKRPIYSFSQYLPMLKAQRLAQQQPNVQQQQQQQQQQRDQHQQQQMPTSPKLLKKRNAQQPAVTFKGPRTKQVARRARKGVAAQKATHQAQTPTQPHMEQQQQQQQQQTTLKESAISALSDPFIPQGAIPRGKAIQKRR